MNSFIFSYNRNDGTVVSGAPFSFASLGNPDRRTTPPEIQSAVTGYFSIGTGHPATVQTATIFISDSLHWIPARTSLPFGGDFLRMDVDLINTYPSERRIHIQRHQLQRRSASRFSAGLCADSFIQGGGEYSQRARQPRQPFRPGQLSGQPEPGTESGPALGSVCSLLRRVGRTECFRPALQSQRFPNAPRYLFAGDTGCPAGGFNPVGCCSARGSALLTTSGGNGKTTIRGGWGIFYQPPFVEAFNNMVDSAPFSPQIQFFGVPFMNPYTASAIRSRLSSRRASRRRMSPSKSAQPGGLVPAQLEARERDELEPTVEHQLQRPTAACRIRRVEGHAPRLQHGCERPAAESHGHGGQ